MVTFEEKKESFHILSYNSPVGLPFRLLGVTINLQLIMHDAIAECSTEAHWRLSSLLRSRRFFSLQDIILQYKSHVLSYLEYRTCAITHAADSHLLALDSVQARLLRNLDINVADALRIFNLAPLCCRRDIANLGIVYRAAMRRGPKQLQKLFVLDASSLRRVSPRHAVHRFQVRDNYRCLHRDYINRSTFGYVGVFNLLPEVVFYDPEFDVPIPVSNFQKNLTRLIKLASENVDHWYEVFSPRVALYNHVLKQFRNVNEVPDFSRA